MSEFPAAGLYRIRGSMNGCTAMILDDQNVLRGELINEPDTYSWYLQYVPGTQKKLCYFEDPKSPGSLGVNSVQTYQPIYRLGVGEGTSIWEIKKTEDGYT
ncbi:hypothetical protein AZE42_07354 [Rhizopogon vesiculosus]|uniref:Ricin B lectin domain-containing protein n=1 Tax=Rhizopogon vesiculosus TaxID=180088 RepID=A0A1J8PZB1_9AGAM|nr:hypothetical protein AZE42_07354 [Rhizopogon vesiculosus]